jgi:ERCC4-related helicase
MAAAPGPVIPRQFQTDLVEFAKRQNTIIYLETGSGKTHIGEFPILCSMKSSVLKNELGCEDGPICPLFWLL